MTLSSFHNQCRFSDSLALSEIVLTLELLSFLQASFNPPLYKRVQSCFAGVSQCAVIDTQQTISQFTVADLNSHPGAKCVGREIEGKGVSTFLSVALPAGCERRGFAQLPVFLAHSAWLVCAELWGELLVISRSLAESLIQGFIILCTSDPR